MLRRAVVLGSVLLGQFFLGCSEPAPPVPDWDSSLLATDPRIVELLSRGQQAVEQSPRSGELRRRLGMALEANGLCAVAEGSYEAAIALDGQDAKAMYRLAACEAEGGDLEEAVRHLEEAIAVDPTYGPSYRRLADLHLLQGDLKRAEANFAKALSIDVDDPAATLGLARTLLQAGRAEAAANLAKEVLRAAPSNEQAVTLLVRAERQLGRTETGSTPAGMSPAQELSWQDPWTRELDPYRVGIASELEAAQVDLAAGRVAEALERLQILIRRRPDDPTVASNLGGALLAAGRPGEAVAVLEPALRDRPDLWSLSMNLAAAYYMNGQLEESAKLIDRTIGMHPDRARMHELRGQVRLALGEEEAGLQSLREAVRLGGDDQALLFRVALEHYQNARWSAAAEAFRALTELLPNRGDYQLALGRSLMSMGELSAARTALSAAERLGVPTPDQLAAAQRELEAATKSL
ncbi:MAG: tetratricopeptide repeat protein [Thermoanaerobaculia bacterium]|nr:tetratricopeptide repeat protein [Thermoanaerobaculia bacterium]